MNERSSTTRVAMKGREERMFFDSLRYAELGSQRGFRPLLHLRPPVAGSVNENY